MLQDIGNTLGLNNREFAALLVVRDALRAGELELSMNDGDKCIAGHMGRCLGVKSPTDYTAEIGKLPTNHPMRMLCFPTPTSEQANIGYTATPALAAEAIDRTLIGADPWP